MRIELDLEYYPLAALPIPYNCFLCKFQFIFLCIVPRLGIIIKSEPENLLRFFYFHLPMQTRPSPRRKELRLPNFDYSEPGWYFVTICIVERLNLFGLVNNGNVVLNAYGAIAQDTWLHIPKHFPNVELDEFIIMPNHIHGILSLTEDGNFLEADKQTLNAITPSLGTLVGAYKAAVSKKINLIRNTPGDSVWQRNYYEHIVSSLTELVRICEYIAGNPSNWQNDEYFLD